MNEETPSLTSAEADDTIANHLDEIPVEKLSPEEVAELEKLNQEIVYVAIDDIKPSSNKARRNLEGVPKVANSIRQCGFRSPIFVNGETDEIVIGHTRWAAAKKLGLTKVPVVYIFDLSPSKLKLLRLADNKVAEFSGWDFRELNIELEELRLELPDFNLGDLGFADEPPIDWEKQREISEDSYEEPTENTYTCPKCGFCGQKRFFEKSEAAGTESNEGS